MNSRMIVAFFAAFLSAVCGCAGANGVPNEASWQRSAVTCTTPDCQENNPMSDIDYSVSGAAGDEGIDSIGSGGWSSSGQLNMGNSVDQVSLQANFPKGDVYTVQFSVTPPSAVGGVIPIPTTRATIMWSINGNFHSRVVDVGNGVSVSGVANAVKVNVQDLSPDPGGSPQYGVDITVARGVRADTGNPPTLFGERVTGVAAAGGAVTILVPINAGVISAEVTASENGVGTPNVTVLQQGGTTQKSYDVGIVPAFVALRPGVVTQLRIVNHDPTNAVDITITWGIDG